MELRWGSFRIDCGQNSLVGQGLVSQKTIDRFLSKVEIVKGGHWRWRAAINAHGYGTFNLGTDLSGHRHGTHNAHRVAYLLFAGPIEKGFDVDHRCHTKDCKLGVACLHRSCVNPAHMAVATHQENLLLGANRWSGTACMRGHPWTTESTIVRKDGSRLCRICTYASNNASYARKTAGREKLPHHNATKKHCPRGHEYTPENTVIRPNGSRACRACQRLANQRSKAKRRAHASDGTAVLGKSEAHQIPLKG